MHLHETQQQFRSNTALTVDQPQPTPHVPPPAPAQADRGGLRTQWLEQGEKPDDWQWPQQWEVGGHIVLQQSRIANDGLMHRRLPAKTFCFYIFKLTCGLTVWRPTGGCCCACFASTGEQEDVLVNCIWKRRKIKRESNKMSIQFQVQLPSCF